MSCHCVSCVSSFRFSTRLAAVNQHTSSEPRIPVWASGRRLSSQPAGLLLRLPRHLLGSGHVALSSHLIPPRLPLLFFPSQGRHQSECLPLAAPFIDFPPSGGSRSSLGDPDRKSSYVFTFCPCMACAHTRMLELACTPAGMRVHSRHRIKTCKTHPSPRCTDGRPRWVFPPEPLG